MPPMGFEPTISAGERPQTYALDHVATGTEFSSIFDQLTSTVLDMNSKLRSQFYMNISAYNVTLLHVVSAT